MTGTDEAVLGPRDDEPHHATEDPWETETWWFSFVVPERKLLGYLYTFMRPNLGTCGGGAMVWDDTGHTPWDALFFDHQWSVPMPELPTGSSLRFPNGTSISVVQPLMRYELGYEHRDLQVALSFDAYAEPNAFRTGRYPFTSATHLDQPGRVHGEIILRAERIAVDSPAMRDRSWGAPRSDLRNTRVGYAFGTAGPSDAFLVFGHPPKDDLLGPETINDGYLVRDGIRSPISSGRRVAHRVSGKGWVDRLEIEATDALGRRLQTTGHAVNRIAFQAYPRMLNWTSLMRWDFDGVEGWGEEQDVWPLDRWRTHLGPGAIAR